MVKVHHLVLLAPRQARHLAEPAVPTARLHTGGISTLAPITWPAVSLGHAHAGVERRRAGGRLAARATAASASATAERAFVRHRHCPAGWSLLLRGPFGGWPLVLDPLAIAIVVELVARFAGDPARPFDVAAEVQFWIDAEKF